MTNKMKYILLAVLLLTFIGQWYVSADMLIEQQTTSSLGVKMKFHTAPVDPYDPFRGRYIRLNFSHDTISVDTSQKYSSGQEVYVVFGTDSNNYAVPAQLYDKQPEGKVYLRCNIGYINRRRGNEGKQKISLDYPFDRYYMNEKSAPNAEKVYRDSGSDDQLNTFAVVSIFKGSTVLESIFINDVTIEEYIELNE